MPNASIVPNTEDSKHSILIKQGQLLTQQIPRDIWDLLSYSGVILQDENGMFRMFYTAYDQWGDLAGPAVVYSFDLKKWTKPNLGQISYSGSTANNLIVNNGINNTPTWDGMEMSDIIYAEGQYVFLVLKNGGTPPINICEIYTSPDGVNWTFSQEVWDGSVRVGGFAESKSIIFVDGVYRLYYRANSLRSLGYYEWYPLNGTPVDQGFITELTAGDINDQYYDIKTFQYAGKVWGAVAKYEGTNFVLGPLQLYCSNDGGVSWEYCNDLLTQGETNTFDSKLIANAKPILVDGTWYLIYVASNLNHSIWPRPMNWGLATGQVEINPKKVESLAGLSKQIKKRLVF